MTDCGATGSALDRSAARFISSAISLGNGNGNAQNTARAGKAISSFLGGVATTGHANANANANGNVIPGSMMPAMAPTNISQMNLNSGNVVHELSASMCNEHAAAMAGNNGNVNAHAHAHAHHPMNQPAHNQIGMNPMMMSHPMNHNPMLQQQQANMQMQMQMNMMQHQQMAMMQMAQQQQQHKQQQKQQQMKHQKVQQQNQKQHQKMEQQSMQNEDQSSQQNLNAEDEDEWHAGLESEFQNYLNSYKNDINANLEANTNANTDVSSTNEYDDGNIEGASIERLAAAWEEAERQFTQEDDYANLASATTGYDYDYDNNTNTGQRILGRPPQHEHYTFSEESRMYGVQEQENNNNIKPKDLMAEGMKHFEEGDTSEAILCFESELQNVDGNNADAWLMLGKCHAENDQDRDAITCLENAVERDPYSSEALLALGVSYVNELDHERALKYLNNWVTHNPNYAGLEMNVDVDVDVDVGGNEAMEGAEGALHQLKALLNQAKAYDESNGNVEDSVDVLEALGVVCNVTREFDEAAECFRTATTLRPDDYQLFNKLGATLANSNRSDEAQDAYQSALAIKPKYARAWLNLAISHSNLKNFDEASRCYLQALSLNPRAGHVWSYLRIALTCSEKWELLPIAASQDLKAFQEHFDFV